MSQKTIFIFGIHSVQALLEKNPQSIQRLAVLKNREDLKLKTILQLAQQHHLKVELISRDELDQMAQGENHQGVVAVRSAVKTFSEQDIKNILEKNPKPVFLILDGVQDPHNLGACLRTADAAGVDAVLAPKDKAVGITSTVSKVASGAAETVPFIQVTNLARTLEFLKKEGVWVYGADASGDQTLFGVDFRGPTAIVLGAEGTGLRRLTRELCDVLVNIPMQGSVSSLNVSVAAGVFLFEVVRQRT